MHSADGRGRTLPRAVLTLRTSDSHIHGCVITDLSGDETMAPWHHVSASAELLLVILGTATALGQVQAFDVENKGWESSDERALDNSLNLTTSQAARYVKLHAQNMKKNLLGNV